MTECNTSTGNPTATFIDTDMYISSISDVKDLAKSSHVSFNLGAESPYLSLSIFIQSLDTATALYCSNPAQHRHFFT